jgi:hypothetical protein
MNFIGSHISQGSIPKYLCGDIGFLENKYSSKIEINLEKYLTC